jgi:hypothetical protein
MKFKVKILQLTSVAMVSTDTHSIEPVVDQHTDLSVLHPGLM